MSACASPNQGVPIEIGELWVFQNDIMGEFAKWAVHLSPYDFPKDLEAVLHDFAHLMKGDWPTVEDPERDVVAVCGPMIRFKDWQSLERYIRGKLVSIPQFCDWNRPKSGHMQNVAVSRWGKPHPDHDFIDLDALIRNVSMGIARENGALPPSQMAEIKIDAATVPDGH